MFRTMVYAQRDQLPYAFRHHNARCVVGCVLQRASAFSIPLKFQPNTKKMQLTTAAAICTNCTALSVSL